MMKHCVKVETGVPNQVMHEVSDNSPKILRLKTDLQF